MNLPLSFVEISRENLVHNFSEFRAFVDSRTKIISVVKANAYGHGQSEVATILNDYTDWFQVDDIEELRLLRRVSQKPVLVAGYVMIPDLEEIVDFKATLLVYDLERLRALNQISVQRSLVTKVHLKIDAELGRQGILLKDLPAFISVAKEFANVKIEAICSHFSNIEDTTDFSQAQKQINDFNRAKHLFEQEGFLGLASHLSATSGIIAFEKDKGVSDFVRLGIGLYGLYPSQDMQDRFGDKFALKPVMRWLTHVAQVKDLPAGYPVGYGMTHITERPTQVALIPQGYSDGYDRGLSNIGEVLIKEARCRVLGRVAMNMFVVDISGLEVKQEDEVVILGAQGSERISAEELADKTSTINYEAVARISPLLKRVVV